ncbi:MAG TPA: hypothetical protein DDW23_00120 [Planctomycetes bacterium]|nr:hypothetical protein [Planctomycetota bacterium]
MKGIYGRLWLDGKFQEGWLTWEAGYLVRVAKGKPPRAGRGIQDLGALRVVPGFVDTLLHGFGGHDAGAASSDDLVVMSKALAASGVTTALAGFYPLELPGFRRAAKNWSQWKGKRGIVRTRFPGWHVEGPFVAPSMRGALPPAGLLPPSRNNAFRFIKACGGWLKMVTLAPEMRGAIDAARAFRKRGVTPSIGHTSAGIEDCRKLAALGPLGMTHLGNRMPSLTPRNPGPVGFALLGEAEWVGIIPDGVHVSDDFLRLCAQTPALATKLMAVSDNLSHAGVACGSFNSGGKRLHRDGPVARDVKGGLAGTLDSLPELVLSRVREGVLTFSQAIKLGSEVPGKLLGDCGRLVPHFRADCVVLNKENQVQAVWVGGKPVKR